jgi:hypothetical protein
VDRLERFVIAILIAFSLALISAPPATADAGGGPPSADPVNYTGQLDDDAVVKATTGQGQTGSTGGGHGSVTILRSYRPVCLQSTDSSSMADDFVNADRCHRASSFCPSADAEHPRMAMWVMKAPASPPPSADDWVNTGIIACVSSGNAKPKVVVTQEDFRRLPIPAPRIITQPPDGYTLINIGTNFLTKKQSIVLPTTVLGQPVRVRATPSTYQWRYGDGGSLATADPGDYYPSMPTAHTYSAPGTYRVSLATVFTGEFSVNGGPWQPIDGTATTRSPGTTVHAEERRAVLIG